jgi:lysine 2,3-aminomutase
MTALSVLPNEPQGIVAKKPPVDPSTLAYRELLRGPFWQRIPAYAKVTEEQFLDHNW